MKKLQDFNFNKSQYERPTQKKVCGWSIYGKPCQIGPNEKGECRAEYECVPYKRNDRWFCTRPSSSGGKCKSGPSCSGVCGNRIPKCVPLNSTRNKRGKVVVWSSLFAVALILIFLFGPLQMVFLSPGDLSSKHSFDNQTCSDCHTVDDSSPSSLIKNAFAKLSVKNESNKCQTCHQLGGNALNPHNMKFAALDEITSRINLQGDAHKMISLFSPAGFVSGASENNMMACVSCHTEHKGKYFDLKQLSNAQCSVCHINQFTGFEDNHPEFTNYPYKRRTGIVFDHNAHINDYFQKEKFVKRSPQGCNNCHVVSVTGMYMDTVSFTKNCSACHGKDVTAEKLEVRGIPVFNLPGIDVNSLKARGLKVGQWPAALEDQEISSFMIYLLSADPQVQPLLSRLLNGEVDLTNLSEANNTTLKQVTAFIWGIKQILYDLSNDGHESMKARLEQISRQTLKPGLSKSLIASLPADVIINAQKSWLPGLQTEVKAYRNGVAAKTRLINNKDISGFTDKEVDNWANAGGWYRQEYSILYRPGGHKDIFLRSWLDFTKTTLTSNAVEQKNLFNQISNKKNPGQCIKCHSIEEQADQVRINWKAGNFDEAVQNFSKFDHSAHFSMLGEDGCKTCHKLDKKSKYLESYKQREANQFAGNFSSIEKAKCQTCHTPANVGDQCLTCHNYHIGKLEPVVPSGKLH